MRRVYRGGVYSRLNRELKSLAKFNRKGESMDTEMRQEVNQALAKILAYIILDKPDEVRKWRIILDGLLDRIEGRSV